MWERETEEAKEPPLRCSWVAWSMKFSQPITGRRLEVVGVYGQESAPATGSPTKAGHGGAAYLKCFSHPDLCCRFAARPQPIVDHFSLPSDADADGEKSVRAPPAVARCFGAFSVEDGCANRGIIRRVEWWKCSRQDSVKHSFQWLPSIQSYTHTHTHQRMIHEIDGRLSLSLFYVPSGMCNKTQVIFVRFRNQRNDFLLWGSLLLIRRRLTAEFVMHSSSESKVF